MSTSHLNKGTAKKNCLGFVVRPAAFLLFIHIHVGYELRDKFSDDRHGNELGNEPAEQSDYYRRTDRQSQTSSQAGSEIRNDPFARIEIIFDYIFILGAFQDGSKAFQRQFFPARFLGRNRYLSRDSALTGGRRLSHKEYTSFGQFERLLCGFRQNSQLSAEKLAADVRNNSNGVSEAV